MNKIFILNFKIKINNKMIKKMDFMFYVIYYFLFKIYMINFFWEVYIKKIDKRKK